VQITDYVRLDRHTAAAQIAGFAPVSSAAGNAVMC
jgi:hypothetical protein